MSRTRTARRLAAVAAPLLLAASLTACGGDDVAGAPEDASKEDFCKAYQTEPDFDDDLDDASTEEQATAIKDSSEELIDNFKEVGTPEDIPDDARKGFESSIEAVEDLDEDDIKKALDEQDAEAFTKLLEGDDAESIEAFQTWAADYCG